MINDASGRAVLMTGGMAAVPASACCLGALVLISVGLSDARNTSLTALGPSKESGR